MPESVKNIDVLILCGGRGKRLRSITSKPKPMLEFGKQPLLDIILNYLAGFGFRRFILGIGYKADVIKSYYGKNKIRSLNIRFCHEKRPLDTGGAVRNAKKLIKSRQFFVLNGDSFCRFNPLEFLRFHKEKKSLVSILLKRVACGKDFGEIKMDRASRISSFREKKNNARNCLINAGVYIFDKRAFQQMPRLNKFSLEQDFFPKIAGKNIFGYEKSGFFIDIGTPQRYLKAKRSLKG